MKRTAILAAACAALLFASPMLMMPASAAAPPVLSMPADAGCTLAPAGAVIEICNDVVGMDWIAIEAVPDFAVVPVAFDGAVAAQASHFANCLKLMFSDPAAHAAECGPGHDVFVSGHSGTSCGSYCPPPASEPVAKQAG